MPGFSEQGSFLPSLMILLIFLKIEITCSLIYARFFLNCSLISVFLPLLYLLFWFFLFKYFKVFVAVQ